MLKVFSFVTERLNTVEGMGPLETWSETSQGPSAEARWGASLGTLWSMSPLPSGAGLIPRVFTGCSTGRCWVHPTLNTRGHGAGVGLCSPTALPIGWAGQGEVDGLTGPTLLRGH